MDTITDDFDVHSSYPPSCTPGSIHIHWAAGGYKPLIYIFDKMKHIITARLDYELRTWETVLPIPVNSYYYMLKVLEVSDILMRIGRQ